MPKINPDDFDNIEDHLRVGLEVYYIHPDYGFRHDRDKSARFLEFGQSYIIRDFYIGGWESTVYLKDVPDGVGFNSVMFGVKRNSL